MSFSTTDLTALGDTVAGSSDVIHDALVAIRNHLGMEVAYFSEFLGGRIVFRRVDAPGLEHLIKVGDSQSLDDVYCNHILAGRLPELMPDTSKWPLAQGLPITSAVPIGSHVSVPVRLADGSAYGMFCCLSPRAIPSLNERDLATMKVFASLATRQVNEDLHRQREARRRIATITSVIADASFEIVFQPIFDIATSRLVSCEALCRFKPSPYRSPDKWFGDAADIGLGIGLELAIVTKTVAAFGALPDGISMSINASPDAVISGELHDTLASACPGRTILEITEHAKVADYGALRDGLQRLKRLGVKVAADDAGAGYSGLQHIIQLAPDIIKLDMSLTRAIDTDQARRALAGAMMSYAREMGSCVVAEGIETVPELETLQRLGAHRGQGYLLGRPGPMAAIHAAAEGAWRRAA